MAFTASRDGSRHLSEVKNAKMSFRMVLRIVRESARYGFRAGHSKIVQVVRMSSARKVGINDTLSEVGAIASDAIEVIFVGPRVELGDELKVLFRRGVHDEHEYAAKQGGTDHFPPLGFVASDARLLPTIDSQVFVAVAVLKDALDFVGAEDGAVPRIFHAVKIDI